MVLTVSESNRPKIPDLSVRFDLPEGREGAGDLFRIEKTRAFDSTDALEEGLKPVDRGEAP